MKFEEKLEDYGVSVCVVTHDNSFNEISDFIVELKPAIEAYPGPVQLVVVNNSGYESAASTQMDLDKAKLQNVCDYSVHASPENNIAIGRNTAISFARFDRLVFIDDDEFPSINWLKHLVDVQLQYTCDVVAGPSIPLFLFDTPWWIRTLDLHNATGKATGDEIVNCPTANVLLHMPSFEKPFFNPEFGRSGGEDSEFFLRRRADDIVKRWSNEAEVFEYIPQAKSTSKYMIKRFYLQGVLNRRILSYTGHITSPVKYTCRSAIAVLISSIVSIVSLIFRHEKAGMWIKRFFGNLGHLVPVKRTLY